MKTTLKLGAAAIAVVFAMAIVTAPAASMDNEDVECDIDAPGGQCSSDVWTYGGEAPDFRCEGDGDGVLSVRIQELPPFQDYWVETTWVFLCDAGDATVIADVTQDNNGGPWTNFPVETRGSWTSTPLTSDDASVTATVSPLPR